MQSFGPWNKKRFLTSNGSSGCRNNSLKNDSAWYSLLSVLVSPNTVRRVEIATHETSFCITLLSISLSYSFDSVVLNFCLDIPSATWFDFPRSRCLSQTWKYIPINALALG